MLVERRRVPALPFDSNQAEQSIDRCVSGIMRAYAYAGDSKKSKHLAQAELLSVASTNYRPSVCSASYKGQNIFDSLAPGLA